MSEDNKKAFSEKTVVQTRASFNTDSNASDDHSDKSASAPEVNEKTVVFAQSNLKETFDAHTVVRSSKPAARVISAADPVLPSFAPAQHEAPVSASNKKNAPPTDEEPKINAAQSNRHAQRQALDRKTRAMIAAFATLCALVILCFVFAFGGPKTADKTVAGTSTQKTAGSDSTELASETSSPVKKPHDAENFQTTSDVLAKFDRAAQKSQERALDYSKSSSGF